MIADVAVEPLFYDKTTKVEPLFYDKTTTKLNLFSVIKQQQKEKEISMGTRKIYSKLTSCLIKAFKTMLSRNSSCILSKQSTDADALPLF